jgi:cytoskeleton protein RodZ
LAWYAFWVPALVVWDQLRRARRDAGLSLNDLAARTKIPVSILASLEHGEAGPRLGTFYTRAFLRAYARELKLDPDAIVRECMAASEPGPVAATAPAVESRRETLPTTTRGRRSWPAIVGAVAALAVMSILRDRPTAPTGPEAGAVGTTGQAHASVVPPSAPEAEKLTLKIRAAGVVWLDVNADGAQVVYQLVQPGVEQVIDARNELKLLVGDAAALEYWINGQPGRPLGGPAEKRRIVVTRQNYRDFLQRTVTP